MSSIFFIGRQFYMRTAILVTILQILVIATLTTSTHAGPLSPPEAPAPTYKTLDEVEARIPIHQAHIPLTIDQSGSYYLAEDLFHSGSDIAIAIAADDVDIDLNGFTLASNRTGVSAGISRLDNQISHDNLAVRNGTIRGFAQVGIVSRGQSLIVENIRIIDCGNGIASSGDSTVVRNCQLLEMGGS